MTCIIEYCLHELNSNLSLLNEIVFGVLNLEPGRLLSGRSNSLQTMIC